MTVLQYYVYSTVYYYYCYTTSSGSGQLVLNPVACCISSFLYVRNSLV